MSSVKNNAPATHIHSGAILSNLYLHWPNLVAFPAATLLTALPILIIVQSGYLVLLHSPPTGNTPKSSAGKKRRKPPIVVPATPGDGLSPPAKPPQKSISASIVPLVLALGFTLLVAAPVIYLLLVAFGAPITTHFDETALTAVHLALLAIYPLVFKMGLDGSGWRSVLALEAGAGEAYLGAVGTFVGAWAGAIPIPLGERCYSGIVLGRVLTRCCRLGPRVAEVARHHPRWRVHWIPNWKVDWVCLQGKEAILRPGAVALGCRSARRAPNCNNIRFTYIPRHDTFSNSRCLTSSCELALSTISRPNNAQRL